MPVGVQCPISSSQGEFPSYWDWLWCPGLSPVLVSIALPFAFHTWCFPFAVICQCWISIEFLLYGRRVATHSVDPSLSHFLGEFPGLGLALIPDVVVSEVEPRFSVWVVRILSRGNPLGSGSQAYLLAACTRQVTVVGYLQGLMRVTVPPANLLHPGREAAVIAHFTYRYL